MAYFSDFGVHRVIGVTDMQSSKHMVNKVEQQYFRDVTVA